MRLMMTKTLLHIDVMELKDYPEHELQQELLRRKAARKPLPAFQCERCGEVGYYVGPFKIAWFEMQVEAFKREHSCCLALYKGGGI